jgi:hypothetical protein
VAGAVDVGARDDGEGEAGDMVLLEEGVEVGGEGWGEVEGG